MLDFLYTTLGFIWFAGMIGTVISLYTPCVKGEKDE